MAKKFEIPKTIQSKTIGKSTVSHEKEKKTEQQIPHRENEPEIPPPGKEKIKRLEIYLYKRDFDLLKKMQKELKNNYGKISYSEIIRYILNNSSIKRFRKGY